MDGGDLSRLLNLALIPCSTNRGPNRRKVGRIRQNARPSDQAATNSSGGRTIMGEFMSVARTQYSILTTFLAVAALALWFQSWSLDGVQGVFLTTVLHQDTAYAAGYTDRGFRSVRVGLNEAQVQSLLGPPLGVRWTYGTTERRGCAWVYFRNGHAWSWVFDECEKLGIRAGLPAADVERLLGTPYEVAWHYSESPTDTHYRIRAIRFSGGRVIEVIKGWYLD
jgi:hypothetical protein